MQLDFTIQQYRKINTKTGLTPKHFQEIHSLLLSGSTWGKKILKPTFSLITLAEPLITKKGERWFFF